TVGKLGIRRRYTSNIGRCKAYSSRMQNERPAVDQVIFASQAVSVSFGWDKANGIARAVCDSPRTEQICGVRAVFRIHRRSVINNDTLAKESRNAICAVC